MEVEATDIPMTPMIDVVFQLLIYFLVTIQPKDGTLGTDDVIMLSCWIEYKRKLLTS